MRGADRAGHGTRSPLASSGEKSTKCREGGHQRQHEPCVLIPWAFLGMVGLIDEPFDVGRRLSGRIALGWGLILRFAVGYGTHLFLTYAGASRPT